MSDLNKDSESKLEQQLSKSYQRISEETTDEHLDRSILAMAAAQQKQAEAKPRGFLASGLLAFFSSKKLKYGFSVGLAMVMTVGIARFMVYLGKTDQSPAQNARVLAANESRQQVELNDSVNFELLEAESRVAREESFATKRVKKDVPNLVTNQEMEDLLDREKLNRQERVDDLAALDRAEEKIESKAEMVVVTGSRIRAVEAEAAASVMNEQSATLGKTVSSPEEIAAGILDEAVSGYPLPEDWLAEISQLIDDGEQAQALEEWQQFSNTYPEFELETILDSQLKSKLEALLSPKQ